MTSDDPVYYEQRAEVELELAQRAEHPAVVQAHYELAESYLARLYGGPENGEPTSSEQIASITRSTD